MENQVFERMQTLEEIAKTDEVYNIWCKSREAVASQFEAYANSQPEEIRNILWGYAGAGEMMWQRKINLACVNMDFLSDKK